jgi:hypothetical protein
VVFLALGLEVFLVRFLWFLSIYRALVDQILAMEYRWGVPTIPKVLCKSMEQFGRSRVGFGGVDSRVLFIPRVPAWPVLPVLLTGLIGAEALWVLPRVFMLIRIPNLVNMHT